MRWILYPEIAAAVEGLPIELSEAELLRIGRQSLSPLRYQRQGGRRSPAMWRSDDLSVFLARRLRHAPEIFQEIELRLSGAVAPKKKAAKS